MDTKIELTLKAVPDNFGVLMDFVNAEFGRYSLPFQSEFFTALEEIFINIASYAYPENPDGEAAVSMLLDMQSETVSITFKDSGIPYNPLEREAPDLCDDLMEREIGGLGIHFVKNFMDKVEYEFADNKNVLTITKAIIKE